MLSWIHKKNCARHFELLKNNGMQTPNITICCYFDLGESHVCTPSILQIYYHHSVEVESTLATHSVIIEQRSSLFLLWQN